MFESSIVNGTVVKVPSEEYSFYAMPSKSKGSDTWLGCGASIISDKHAISSAHCFGGGTMPCQSESVTTGISLFMGDMELNPNSHQITQKAGGKYCKVDATVKCLTTWDGKCSHGHDIAFLDLVTPLSQTEGCQFVKPVPLHFDTIDPGSKLEILGNGDMEAKDGTIGKPSRFLRTAQVEVWAQSNAACSNVWKGGYGCSDKASEAPADQPRGDLFMQFCAGNQMHVDTCSGDSGSPVVGTIAGKKVQVGLVSYGGGPETTNTNECGDPRWPGMYASVPGLKAGICQKWPDLEGCGSTTQATAGAPCDTNAAQQKAKSAVKPSTATTGLQELADSKHGKAARHKHKNRGTNEYIRRHSPKADDVKM
jgi:hypothetical protein